MKTIIGDLIKEAENYDFIIHGCNCFSVMGAGIARTIRKFYPEAYEVDKNSSLKPIDKLGSITITKNTTPLIINAYTQYDYKNKKDVEYCAVRSTMRKIKELYGGKNMKFAMPMIGAGLAGGNWEVISGIIKEELKNEDVTVIIWDQDIDNYKYSDSFVKNTSQNESDNSTTAFSMDDLID